MGSEQKAAFPVSGQIDRDDWSLYCYRAVMKLYLNNSDFMISILFLTLIEIEIQSKM